MAKKSDHIGRVVSVEKPKKRGQSRLRSYLASLGTVPVFGPAPGISSAPIDVSPLVRGGTGILPVIHGQDAHATEGKTAPKERSHPALC